MQLVKMELRGFKSFADKTILTFDKGITAIVGPNGSGKSNISDAVRWVMGEQNVRQLRGQKSEDIIFSGTEKRRPQGVAEVSLYFDNTDHALPVDLSEVVVTRRIFRSGDSEFYINKRSCRLKDVHQLFADTGIGQDSMAVIGQNRVDRILNSKPDERRVIFEEVAGISRYKGRKQEGLRKIADTDRNLERIHDTMAVLEEQLGPLEKQAERTREFSRLDAERIAYEGTLALQELRNAERLLEKMENSRSTAAAGHEETARTLTEIQQKRQGLLAAMEEEERALQHLGEEALSAHNDLNGMKSRKEAFEQRCRELEEEAGRLAEDAAALVQKGEEFRQQQSALEVQQQTKEKEAQAAQSSLSLSQDLFRQAEAAAAARDKELQDLTARRSQQEQKIFGLKKDIQSLEQQWQDKETQRDGTDRLLYQRRQEEEALAAQHKVKTEECHAAREALAVLEKELQVLRTRRQKAAQENEKAGRQYLALRSEMAGLAQRIKVLEGMEQDHEGLSRAAREVLTARQSWQSAICGVVGTLCRIPTEYATALDVALGAAAQFVVVENEQSAKAAISYLKQRHAGRTTFLPLDTVREKHRTTDEERAAQEEGILGFANDLLQYDPIYGRIFSSLLGKTLIADSMDTGTAVARRYGHRLRIVCLDGTQFNAGGSLTGGSNRAKEGSLISRRALLEELKEKLTAGRSQESAMSVSRQEQERQMAQYSTEEQQADSRHREAEGKVQQLQWELRTLEQKAEQLRQDIQTSQSLSLELAETSKALQEARVQKEGALRSLGDVTAEDGTALEAEAGKAAAEKERCRQCVMEQQVLSAKLQEQLHYLQKQMDDAAAWRAQNEAALHQLQERQKNAADRRTETAQLLQDLEGRLQTKVQEVQDKDKAKEEFYQARTAHFKESQTLEQELTELRSHNDEWQRKLNSAEVQMEKYRSDIRHCEELLAAQGLTRQAAMEQRRSGTLKELNDQVSTLRRRIAALGQVNPNAAKEYDEARKKRDFLQGQCDDLLEARKGLEKVVAEIDHAMAGQFQSAFAEISGFFQIVFERLFGGGRAVISLSDSKDVLAAGVDIYIQPPGKKQQQLSLLSGGERALTVIALLFSFLAYHPAPFCLLDEVDAALDEANVERLGAYLKNYSGDTQFIVITHRRKTMEAANILQGVTMEEKGVSRLLTVKVDDLLKEGT